MNSYNDIIWKWWWKIDHTNKTYINLYVDIDANMQNITCLGNMMCIWKRQDLSNIWDSIE